MILLQPVLMNIVANSEIKIFPYLTPLSPKIYATPNYFYLF
jgi:hypothetical protein